MFKKSLLFLPVVPVSDMATIFKQWRIVIFLAVAILLIIMNLDKFSGIRGQSVDRRDYAAVAVDFIKSSGFIGQRLGKVESVSHFGVGGAGGKESFNVFRIVGHDRSGLINMTLTRNEAGEWFVKTADLSVSGSEYEVPVTRSEGNKWRLFKMR
jgi:hypothetical protein